MDNEKMNLSTAQPSIGTPTVGLGRESKLPPPATRLVCYDISSDSEEEMECQETVQIKEEPPEISDEEHTNYDNYFSLSTLRECDLENIAKDPKAYCENNVEKPLPKLGTENNNAEIPNPDNQTCNSYTYQDCNLVNGSKPDYTKQLSDVADRHSLQSASTGSSMQEICISGDYREPEQPIMLTSDSDDSSTLDSSSSSESNSSSDEADDEAEKTETVPDLKKKQPCRKKSKDPYADEDDDLPPIEDLQISVEEKETKPIGYIYQIVENKVVVQSYPDHPAIDLDSVLFLDLGKRALGKVFDVFGGIQEPLYVIRFNSSEHIREKEIEKGMQVYYAPQSEHTAYVILEYLIRERGSDASWKDNREPPLRLLEYSDDEKERKAKQTSKLKKLQGENAIKKDLATGSKKEVRNTYRRRTSTPDNSRNFFANRSGWNNFRFGSSGQFGPSQSLSPFQRASASCPSLLGPFPPNRSSLFGQMPFNPWSRCNSTQSLSFASQLPSHSMHLPHSHSPVPCMPSYQGSPAPDIAAQGSPRFPPPPNSPLPSLSNAPLSLPPSLLIMPPPGPPPPLQNSLQSFAPPPLQIDSTSSLCRPPPQCPPPPLHTIQGLPSQLHIFQRPPPPVVSVQEHHSLLHTLQRPPPPLSVNTSLCNEPFPLGSPSSLNMPPPQSPSNRINMPSINAPPSFQSPSPVVYQSSHIPSEKQNGCEPTRPLQPAQIIYPSHHIQFNVPPPSFDGSGGQASQYQGTGSNRFHF